jgi:glycosyltransferase involved in cell wall biosynthesis
VFNVLIVAETYPYPEHRNGLAKINANLLVKNSYYNAEMLCIADRETAKDMRPGIHRLSEKPIMSTGGKMRRYLSSSAPIGEVKARPYFEDMAEFIRANHSRFDVIHVSSSYLAGLIDYVSPEIARKMVLFAIDSVSLFWSRRAKAERNPIKRAIYLHEYRRNVRHEKLRYPRFSKTVFVSSVDATFAGALAPDANCITIPNGVDIDYFNVGVAERDGSMVFTGDLAYAPNRDAADFLIDEVLPRIPADLMPHFYLVGQRPSANLTGMNRNDITVTGFVDDLRPYLANASVYVSPLRFGSGIKNKVLEAMSMGLTVIGTPVSFEGIECQDGRDCIVAQADADDLAKRIMEVVKNPELLSSIGAAARQLIEKKYSWDSIRKAYGQVYADSVNYR